MDREYTGKWQDGLDAIIKLRDDPDARRRIDEEIREEKRRKSADLPQQAWNEPKGSVLDTPPEQAWGEIPPGEAQMEIRGPMRFRHLLTIAKNGTNRLSRIEFKPPAVIRGGIVAARVLGSAAALILGSGSYRDADKSK